MKQHYFFLLVFLLIVASIESLAQNTKDAYKQRIAAYREQLARAAGIFMNDRLSDEERIKAVSQTSEFLSPEHIAQAKKIVQNADESPLIRSVALSKVQSNMPKDLPFTKYVLDLVKNQQTPGLLRNQSLTTVRVLGFSTGKAQSLNDEINETMRQLLKDKNTGYREAALSWLIPRGDEYANRLLIESINRQDQSVLPLAKSIQMLGLKLTSDAYPALHKVLKSSQPDSVKSEAVKLLGAYEPARNELVQLLQNSSANEKMRFSAISALSANKTDKFAEYILPVVTDERAPENLRVYGIRAEMYRRVGSSNKNLRLQSDNFDNAVRNLMRASSSQTIRSVSQQYIAHVNPRF